MAVVQISRLQVRRGRKNTGSSIPQLASGELGWAIDSQELYIGNGSVAEGAPFVGNTKIVTERDSIFDLPNQYIFRRGDARIQTGFSFANPVERNLQDRLDDRVSVRAFGVTDDNDIDTSIEERTSALQRAIDNLFLNIDSVNPESRVTLWIEPGVYTINQALRIPPYATVRGAGKDKTIIRQTGDAPVIKTVGSLTAAAFETVGDHYDFSSGNPTTLREQPRYVVLSGLTLQHTKKDYPLFEMNSVKESLFDEMKFSGSWDPTEELVPTNTGIEMTAIAPGSSLITCETNLFKNCEFSNLSYGIRSRYDIIANNFENCLFKELGRGIDFGYQCHLPDGMYIGPRFNRITACRFFDIDREAIVVVKGIGNLSQNNVFENVGGPNEMPAYPVIRFQDSSNTSIGDWFQRSVSLSDYDPINEPALAAADYLGEYAGSVRGEHRYNITIPPVYKATPETLFRLSGYDNLRYRVHYLYKSTAASVVRNGMMYVTVDRSNSTVRLSDEYDVVGDFSSAENLKFTAEFDQTLPNTVNVKYTNLTTGDLCNGNTCVASFGYWYEVIS